ncbi:MAG: hypothetical protein AVDCRST_MAG16-2526, partial [uncultured Frankineae bacterium]
ALRQGLPGVAHRCERLPATGSPPAARRSAHAGGGRGPRLPRGAHPGAVGAARRLRRRRRLLRAQRLPHHLAAAARARPQRAVGPAPLLRPAPVAALPGADPRVGRRRRGDRPGAGRLRPGARQPGRGAGRAGVRHELVVRARADRRPVPARAHLVAVGRGALLPAVAAAAAGRAAPRREPAGRRRDRGAGERLADAAAPDRRRPRPALLPARLPLRPDPDRVRARRAPGPARRAGAAAARVQRVGRPGRARGHRGRGPARSPPGRVVLARRSAGHRGGRGRRHRPPGAARRQPAVAGPALGPAARAGAVVVRHLPVAPAAHAPGAAGARREPRDHPRRRSAGRPGRGRVVPLRRAAAAAAFAPDAPGRCPRRRGTGPHAGAQPLGRL